MIKRIIVRLCLALAVLSTAALWYVSYAEYLPGLMQLARSPEVEPNVEMPPRPQEIRMSKPAVRDWQHYYMVLPPLSREFDLLPLFSETPPSPETAVNDGLLDRFVLDFGAADSTETRSIRTTDLRLGVGYKVSSSAQVGIEARKEFADMGDAGAIGRDTNTEEGVNLRYLFQF